MHRERTLQHWGTNWLGVGVAVALCLDGGASRTSAAPESATDGTDPPPEGALARTEIPVLSVAERDWLARHPVVTVAFDPQWPPIEYLDSQGKPSGLSSEYLKHLERMLGVKFRPAQALSWDQAVTGLGDGTIEMASAVQANPKRKAFLLFTTPYMSLPLGIFTKADVAYADLSTLKSKPVTVIQNFAVHDFLAEHHPEIPLVPARSIRECLELVRQGRAFAFLEVFVIGNHGINDCGYLDLHAAGTSTFRHEVSMGASVKHPELASILEKSLAAIPPQAHARYYQRWFSVPFVPPTDRTTVWWILAGAASLLAVVLVWNRRLERSVVRRTLELAQANERLEQRVADRTAELEKANATLDSRATRLRTLATELAETEDREHRRIAQILHDHPQQLLTAAKYSLAALLGRQEAPQLRTPIEQVMSVINQTMESLRSLTMELSPPILHDAGFASGVQWLARWFGEKYALVVDVTDRLPPSRLPEDLSILLFQGVRELLFNVVKHAGATPVHVTLDAAEEGLRITVADEGQGFDATVGLTGLPRTFGLFSLQERLTLIGGSLELASTPGCGTTVTLRVPLVLASPPADGPQPTQASTTSPADAAVRPHPNRVRILVVDDHTVMRQGLMQLLARESDFEVVGAAVDGLDAVEKAHAFQPDVILMDISMPRMNGLEATRRIVAELPTIGVICLSLHEPEEMMPQMQAAGARRYLVKSCPIEEIIAAVRDVAQAPD